jgi:addiction module HigA family antidote
MEMTMPQNSADFPIAVHPGEILQEMIDDRGITQVLLAKHLRTDVARINEICRGRRGISATMAVMLSKTFATSADLWMNLQKNWELSQVDKSAAKHIRPLRRSA